MQGSPLVGDAPILDEEMRRDWGPVHHSNMGEEFLPPLRNGELEIARISLGSVVQTRSACGARGCEPKLLIGSSTSTRKPVLGASVALIASAELDLLRHSLGSKTSNRVSR
jgi:hypothetical protein